MVSKRRKTGSPFRPRSTRVSWHDSIRVRGEQIQIGNKMIMNSRSYLRFKLRPVSHLIALALLMFAGGCGRDDVKVYRVAKETSPAPAQATMPAGHPDISTAANPQLKWKTPEGWNEVPPGEMRVASFNVKGKNGKQADVSVIPLPGAAGGDAANVNRWRGQLGLAPVTPEELQKAAQKVEVAGQPAELHDIVGTNPEIRR